MANADGLDHMLNRVMPKDNIGLAALLQTTEAAWDNSESNLKNHKLKFSNFVIIFYLCNVTCYTTVTKSVT